MRTALWEAVTIIVQSSELSIVCGSRNQPRMLFAAQASTYAESYKALPGLGQSGEA